MQILRMFSVVSLLLVSGVASAAQPPACEVAGSYCSDLQQVCYYDCRAAVTDQLATCQTEREACLAGCDRRDRQCRPGCQAAFIRCRQAQPANCRGTCLAEKNACLQDSTTFCDGALACETVCRTGETQCLEQVASDRTECFAACPTAAQVRQCRVDCQAENQCAAGRAGAACRAACVAACPTSQIAECRGACREAFVEGRAGCKTEKNSCLGACQEPFQPCFDERAACFVTADEAFVACQEECGRVEQGPRVQAECLAECRSGLAGDQRNCRAVFVECVGNLLADRDHDGVTPYVGDCDDANPLTYPGAEENCDGLDNNCNTVTDEGIAPEPTFCGVGECAAAGELLCLEGELDDTCVPGLPSPDDDCDALDDDCDGPADEHYLPVVTECGVGLCAATGQTACANGVIVDSCQPGEPVEESCNGEDDDCDGHIDEDCQCSQSVVIVSDEQTTVNGQPAVATWDANSRWTARLPGAVWIWDTYLEDAPNVDGWVTFDRAFDLPLGGNARFTGGILIGGDNSYVCYVNGEGPYASAIETNYFAQNIKFFDLSGVLVPGPNLLRCEVHNWAQPGGNAYTNPGGLLFRMELAVESTAIAELCDGFDNDCDGDADEDFVELGMPCTVGLGACLAEGLKICAADGQGYACDATPGAPSEEVCGDGIDNDCDGSLDEGCWEPCGTNWPYPCEVELVDAFNLLYGTDWSEMDYPGLQQLAQARSMPLPELWDTTMVEQCQVLAFDTSGTASFGLQVLTPGGYRFVTLADPGPWTPTSRGWWPTARGSQLIDLAQLLEQAGYDPATPFRFAMSNGPYFNPTNTYRLQGMVEGEWLFGYNEGGLQGGDRDANEPIVLCVAPAAPAPQFMNAP